MLEKLLIERVFMIIITRVKETLLIIYYIVAIWMLVSGACRSLGGDIP